MAARTTHRAELRFGRCNGRYRGGHERHGCERRCHHHWEPTAEGGPASNSRAMHFVAHGNRRVARGIWGRLIAGVRGGRTVPRACSATIEKITNASATGIPRWSSTMGPSVGHLDLRDGCGGLEGSAARSSRKSPSGDQSGDGRPKLVSASCDRSPRLSDRRRQALASPGFSLAPPRARPS